MTSEERLRLISGRFCVPSLAVSKPKGLHVATTPGAIPATLKRKQQPIRGGEVYSAPHVTENGTRRLREKAPWIARPDEPERKEWAPSQRRGLHPLTVIAEKWKSLKRD